MMRVAEELSDFIEAAGLLKYDPQTISEIYIVPSKTMVAFGIFLIYGELFLME